MKRISTLTLAGLLSLGLSAGAIAGKPAGKKEKLPAQETIEVAQDSPVQDSPVQDNPVQDIPVQGDVVQKDKANNVFMGRLTAINFKLNFITVEQDAQTMMFQVNENTHLEGNMNQAGANVEVTYLPAGGFDGNLDGKGKGKGKGKASRRKQSLLTALTIKILPADNLAVQGKPGKIEQEVLQERPGKIQEDVLQNDPGKVQQDVEKVEKTDDFPIPPNVELEDLELDIDLNE